MWARGLETMTHNMYARDLLYVLYIVLTRGYTRCTVFQPLLCRAFGRMTI
jgi:hypothetical protein